jgi:hypothetical protein
MLRPCRLPHVRYGSAMLMTLAVSLAFAATPPAVAAPPAVPPTESERDFVPIFNGRDLTGWTGPRGEAPKGYAVEDGAIVCRSDGRNLYTVEEYGDFILRFRFQLTPGANNGIGVRTPNEGDAAYKGLEIQVLDNTAERWAGLKPWQYHGSIYGIAAAEHRDALKPVGEWNEEEIEVRGRRVKVTLNGVVLVDVDLDEATKSGTLSGQAHPGVLRSRGHICFCGHGDRVAFKDLAIRELP